MARHWSTLCLLLFSGAFCGLALDVSRLEVTPKKAISGVSLVTLNNQYSFNASVASDVCKALHVNIASKAHVETALKNGLEMCKFGWVEERIAVVPRIQGIPTCGNNKTGLVTWRAPESKLFGVFCFNSTDTVTTPRATTASIPTQGQERSTSPRNLATFPPVLLTSTLTKRTPLTTSAISHASVLPRHASKAPAPPPKPTSTSQNKLHTTTIPTTPTHLLSFSPPSSSPSRTVHAGLKSNLGAATIAILITVAVFLIFAMVALYHKKNGRSLPCQRQEQEKEAVETEMFKHFRERDLKRHHSGGDGERSRKCSSDITLLMEQEAKAEIA